MSRTINRPEWSQYLHNGIAFGVSFSFTGVASTADMLQLYNPIGSKVRLVVFFAGIAPGATSQTVLALDPALQNTGGTLQTPVNLLAGSPTLSKAQVYTSQPTTPPVPPAIGYVRRSLALGNTKDDTFNPEGAICELSEGQGLDLFTNTLNISAFSTVWWAEVPTAQYA